MSGARFLLQPITNPVQRPDEAATSPASSTARDALPTDAGRSLAARRSRIAQEIADEINAPLRAMTAHERSMYPLLRELMRLRHRTCDVRADHDDEDWTR